MIARFFLVTIAAGVIGGIFSTLAQSISVVPIILESETYEDTGVALHTQYDLDIFGNESGHVHSEEDWGPKDGTERTFYTFLSNVITGIGFSLLLGAALLLSRSSISPKIGLIWGVAGFISFNLAPGLGLPPELPGMASAELVDRQIWWFITATLTASGLALIAFSQFSVWIVLGLVIIAVPHLYGAPQPSAHESLVPAALAAEFIVVSLVTASLGWLVIAASLGVLLPKFVPEHVDQE